MNRVDSFIGRRIRQFRWLCGVTQGELAQQLSVGAEQISAFEAGTDRVASAQLLQIAGVLDIPVASFFDGMASAPGATDNDQPKALGAGQARLLSHFNLMTDQQHVAHLKMAPKLGQMASPLQDSEDLRPSTATER